jgi:hypothetical protein
MYTYGSGEATCQAEQARSVVRETIGTHIQQALTESRSFHPAESADFFDLAFG